MLHVRKSSALNPCWLSTYDAAVALFTSAWIETEATLRRRLGIDRRALHERVD